MTYFDAGPGLPYSAFLNLPKSSAHVRIPKVSWQSDSVRIVHGIRTVKAGDARLAEVGDATETEASGVAWNLMKRLQMFADQIHAIRFKSRARRSAKKIITEVPAGAVCWSNSAGRR